VLLGNGDGTFGTKSDYGTGSSPRSVAIGDLNADGKPDLAVANALSNTVSVLLGNGDGTFGLNRDYGTGGGPYSVVIGDVNGDGKPDLVVANDGGNYGTAVPVLRGNGYGPIGPNGDYGPATEDAVKQFQRSAGLADDGIVGSETLRKLRSALSNR